MQEWIDWKGMRVYYHLENLEVKVSHIEVRSHVAYAEYLQKNKFKDAHRFIENDSDFLDAVAGQITFSKDDF